MPFHVAPQKPKVDSIIILSPQIRKRPAQGHVTSKRLISSLSVFSIVQYVNGKFINRGFQHKSCPLSNTELIVHGSPLSNRAVQALQL